MEIESMSPTHHSFTHSPMAEHFNSEQMESETMVSVSSYSVPSNTEETTAQTSTESVATTSETSQILEDFSCNEYCSICYGEFDENEHEKRLLPCRHAFCSACMTVLKQDKEKYNCQMCRAEYYCNDDSPVHTNNDSQDEVHEDDVFSEDYYQFLITVFAINDMPESDDKKIVVNDFLEQLNIALLTETERAELRGAVLRPEPPPTPVPRYNEREDRRTVAAVVYGCIAEVVNILDGPSRPKENNQSWDIFEDCIDEENNDNLGLEDLFQPQDPCDYDYGEALEALFEEFEPIDYYDDLAEALVCMFRDPIEDRLLVEGWMNLFEIEV